MYDVVDLRLAPVLPITLGNKSLCANKVRSSSSFSPSSFSSLSLRWLQVGCVCSFCLVPAVAALFMASRLAISLCNQSAASCSAYHGSASSGDTSGGLVVGAKALLMEKRLLHLVLLVWVKILSLPYPHVGFGNVCHKSFAKC